MLTFCLYSAAIGFCFLYPAFMATQYYGDRPGNREITYANAGLSLLLCICPAINVVAVFYTVCQGTETLLKNLSGKTLITDKK